jgi:GMP synthase (glutamine-hydrolysing)
MRKILVCQHVAHEVLGTLDPLFRSGGFRIRYANFGRFPDLKPSLDGYAGLVILGGPMNVGDDTRYPHLKTEIKLIEIALKMNIPILGICLGSQLVANALGAPVVKNHECEIGWHPLSFTEHAAADPMFRHMTEGDHVFHWHGCKFDVPQTAVKLATSKLTENQAFRYGNKVYALQFHLEVDESSLERWLKVPFMRDELTNTNGPAAHDTIITQSQIHLPRQKHLSDHVFGEFIDLFGHRKTRKRLSLR